MIAWHCAPTHTQKSSKSGNITLEGSSLIRCPTCSLYIVCPLYALKFIIGFKYKPSIRNINTYSASYIYRGKIVQAPLADCWFPSGALVLERRQFGWKVGAPRNFGRKKVDFGQKMRDGFGGDICNEKNVGLGRDLNSYGYATSKFYKVNLYYVQFVLFLFLPRLSWFEFHKSIMHTTNPKWIPIIGYI